MYDRLIPHSVDWRWAKPSVLTQLYILRYSNCSVNDFAVLHQLWLNFGVKTLNFKQLCCCWWQISTVRPDRLKAKFCSSKTEQFVQICSLTLNKPLDPKKTTCRFVHKMSENGEKYQPKSAMMRWSVHFYLQPQRIFSLLSERRETMTVFTFKKLKTENSVFISLRNDSDICILSSFC